MDPTHRANEVVDRFLDGALVNRSACWGVL